MMDFEERLVRRGIPRAEMLERVARFADLQGFDGGLADSRMPGCERTLFNVMGFQPPVRDGAAGMSPVGDEAARVAAIKVSEGFNIGFCRAKPGNGPLLHNHDTNETFIAITGTWRGVWLDDHGREDWVDLRPLDTISFPSGAVRRFQNVTAGDPQVESLLLFVIGGDAPEAEFSREAVQALARAGLWSGPA